MLVDRSRLATKKTTREEEEPSSAAEPEEAHYSIRVTSRLTSIPLDTLRMWERRYGFPRPERTPGGSRVYAAGDVETLKLIQRALGRGYRPGEVVGKTRGELTLLLRATASTPAPAATGTPTIATLMDALRRDDLSALRAELRQAAVVLGPKRFLVEVAHPVCIRVGELWADGTLEVRHEHVLSECLSAQLRLLMSAYEDGQGSPRVLLATLPNERHGLGLEMVQVYLGASQITPVLLGPDTPPEQIVKAAQSHAVDAVGLLVTHASDLKETADSILWMLAELPRRVAIWVGGAAGPELDIPGDAVRIVPGWAEMDSAISTLLRRTR